MPKYVYKCNNCEDVFEKFHSIKTVLQDCEKCLTEYKMSGSLERVPSQVLIVSHGSKEGKIVRQSIKDTKEDIKTFKDELRSAKHE